MGYPFSLFMHYGLNRLVLFLNTLLLIRHGTAKGRLLLEEKAGIQILHIPAHWSLLAAQTTFSVFEQGPVQEEGVFCLKVR